MDFTLKIREKTNLLHSAAEHSGYIKRLVDGNGTKKDYGEYIFNLHAIYKAIEEGLEANKIIKWLRNLLLQSCIKLS